MVPAVSFISSCVIPPSLASTNMEREGLAHAAAAAAPPITAWTIDIIRPGPPFGPASWSAPFSEPGASLPHNLLNFRPEASG